jgi:hypothetical protein
LPPSLAIRKDVELTLQRIASLLREGDVRREIASLNARIREANLRSYWGPPSTQLPLDEEAVIAQWSHRHGRND